VRASERHLMLEFSFNLNHGCGGWERRSHTSFFSTTPLITSADRGESGFQNDDVVKNRYLKF